MSSIAIFTECPPLAVGMTGLITIGQMGPAGTCFNMGMLPPKPLSELPAYVCDAGAETDTHGEDRIGYWTRYHAQRIKAQVKAVGFAGIDLSGWCFARCIQDAAGVYERNGQTIAMPGDKDGAEFVIEPIRQLIAECGQGPDACEPDEDWLFWANVEPTDTYFKLVRSYFRTLWDRGITGKAMLCVTNMVGGTAPKRLFETMPRAIDGACSELPIWFSDEKGGGNSPWGSDAEVLARLPGLINDIHDMKLKPVAHMCSVGYDGYGKRVSQARLQSQLDAIDICKGEGVEKWLVFNKCSQQPVADHVEAIRADVGTVEAIL